MPPSGPINPPESAEAAGAASAASAPAAAPASGEAEAAPKAAPDAGAPPVAAAPAYDIAKHLRLATFGSNEWGARGLYRAYSAYTLNPYALVLTIGDNYFLAHGMFVQGDKDTQSVQQMHIAFSPVRGLEVGLSQLALSNRYQAASQRVLQVQGSPMLHLKYGYAIFPDLAVGIYGGLQLPTSALGSGLKASAFVAPFKLLVSYTLRDRVEFVGNIGYTIDRSRNVFAADDLDALKRFAYGVNQIDQLSYALGAQGHLSAGGVVDFAPFAEVSGAMGFGAAATRQNAPFRGTLGLKLYLTQSRSIELSGGADMRFGGQPEATSPFMGVPPWSIFGQLSFHVNDRLPPGKHKGPRVVHCQTDSDCSAGLSCMDQMCLAVRTQEARQTFVVAGSVVDGTTGEPVSGARLTFGDYQNTVLAGDDRSGQFASWPLVASAQPLFVRIDAPGYASTTQTLKRGKPGEVQQLSLRMDSTAQLAQGSMRGSIKDGHTGKAVRHAVVFLPGLGRQIHTDDEGNFQADIKVGVYQVLISAKNYITQKKQVRVREGDVVIINADLLPKHGRRH
jgi:hypothetical protein